MSLARGDLLVASIVQRLSEAACRPILVRVLWDTSHGFIALDREADI